MAGAVIGVAVLATLTSLIQRLQDGQGLGPISLDLPNGIDTVIVAIILLVMLVKRPNGLTGGRELAVPRRLRAWLGGRPEPAVAAAPAPAAGDAGIADPAVAVVTADAGAEPDASLPAGPR
jgi:branched-chain amino acid transport system permease protein